MIPYKFTKIPARDIENYQKKLLRKATAPLDGMWLSFASMANHYLISGADQTVGYAAINTDQKLLQFYVDEGQPADQIFEVLVQELEIKGAVISTAEPHNLSRCLGHYKTITVNGLMYHVPETANIEPAAFPEGSVFQLIKSEELETAIDFAHEALGADRGWLNGYYNERIEGGELFGLWQGTSLIAAGECRPSVQQPPYADVGMVVSPDQRSKGLATNILRQLIKISCGKGLQPICSTEIENIAARKSISKAGFISDHRILDIIF